MGICCNAIHHPMLWSSHRPEDGREGVGVFMPPLHKGQHQLLLGGIITYDAQGQQTIIEYMPQY